MVATVKGQVEAVVKKKTSGGKEYTQIQLSTRDSKSGLLSLCLISLWNGAAIPKIGDKWESEVSLRAFAPKGGAQIQADVGFMS